MILVCPMPWSLIFTCQNQLADYGLCVWCYELVMDAYKKAIKDKYRFYTYGDAMLII
jgi:hypothetical protein